MCCVLSHKLPRWGEAQWPPRLCGLGSTPLCSCLCFPVSCPSSLARNNGDVTLEHLRAQRLPSSSSRTGFAAPRSCRLLPPRILCGGWSSSQAAYLRAPTPRTLTAHSAPQKCGLNMWVTNQRTSWYNHVGMRPHFCVKGVIEFIPINTSLMTFFAPMRYVSSKGSACAGARSCFGCLRLNPASSSRS